MKQLVFTLVLLAVALFVYADQTAEEKAAEKKRNDRDIRIDRERSAIHSLREAIERAEARQLKPWPMILPK